MMVNGASIQSLHLTSVNSETTRQDADKLSVNGSFNMISINEIEEQEKLRFKEEEELKKWAEKEKDINIDLKYALFQNFQIPKTKEPTKDETYTKVLEIPQFPDQRDTYSKIFDFIGRPNVKIESLSEKLDCLKHIQEEKNNF